MTTLNLTFLAVGICIGALAATLITYFLVRPLATEQVNRIEFGVRMTKEDGVSVYGIDEIQALLEEGAKITDIQSNGATFQKAGEDEDNVRLYFSGGSFEASLDCAAKNQEPSP